MNRYGVHPTWASIPLRTNHYLLGFAETTG